MTRVAIRWLILSMGLSLIGLIVFQIYWIENIIGSNEVAFKRNVQEALTEVVEKLEKQEVLKVAVDNFHADFIFQSMSNVDSSRVELIESTFEKKIVELQDFVKDSTARPEWVSFYFNSGKGQEKLNDVSIKLGDKAETSVENKIVLQKADSIQSNRKEYESRVKSLAKKSEYVQLAMHQLFTGEKSLEKRIDKNEVDSLINISLTQRGIDLPYLFAIYDPLKEKVIIQNYDKPSRVVIQSDLRATLFPNDILGEAGYLIIHFSEQESYLLGKIWWTMSSSLVFILIVLGSFGFAIRMIYRQKKVSEIKNDFINNMTHEFKTPISTVSLACEALQDKEINGSESLKKRYLGIIQDENKRLGLQVEKVLQMAVIERKDFELKLEKVHIHQIIAQAIASINIQVTSKGGILKKDLRAVKDCVEADEVHLTNIVFNLLDNANKYSPDKPNILITTNDTARGIEIKVRDYGIGMARDKVKRIFEKFYRIPTGNLHDVKGFGLGLSYVKTMIEAHGGSVIVNSEIKKGSEFILFVPYHQENIFV